MTCGPVLAAPDILLLQLKFHSAMQAKAPKFSERNRGCWFNVTYHGSKLGFPKPRLNERDKKNTKNESMIQLSFFTRRIVLSQTAWCMRIPAATETLKESTIPLIGILQCISDNSRASSLIPLQFGNLKYHPRTTNLETPAWEFMNPKLNNKISSIITKNKQGQ